MKYTAPGSPGRPPRIAFLLDEFPALSETFVLDQITGLIDLGADVSVIATKPREGEAVHPQISAYGLDRRVSYLGPDGRALSRAFVSDLAHHLWRGRIALAAASLRRKAFRRALSLKLLRIVDGLAPDAVVCHFGHNGALLAPLCRIAGSKTRVATVFHGFDMSSALVDGKAPYEKLFEDGDLFLPVTKFWRERLISMGCPSHRTHVHRMGIDTSSLAPTKKASGGPFTFMMTGRMVEKKGHRYAVEALALMLAESPSVRVRLVLAGDGPLRREIVELCEALGIAENVEFLGAVPRDRVMEAMATADAFVLPSVIAADGDMEGLPVAILEAMAFGVPVISTRHSGIPEAVTDNVSGLLAPERDAQALSARMAQVYGNPSLRERLARGGRAAVQDEFDLAYWNAKLLALLTLARPSASGANSQNQNSGKLAGLKDEADAAAPMA